MKKILLLILPIVMFVYAGKAQDHIYMKDGSEYKAKVQEITPDVIKFKKYDQQDGPVRTVKVQDVISIKYQDGTEEVFGKTIEKKETKETEKEQYVYSYENAKDKTPEKPKSKFELNGHHKYVSLGGGFGNSYGGAGTRFQFRVGRTVGFGLHTGLGLYTAPFRVPGDGSFRNRLQFDIGLKLFCYKWIYIDFQMGMVGRDSGYYLYRKEGGHTYRDVLFGPALLVGADYIFGKHLGVNLGGGLSFPITDVNGSGNGTGPETESETYPAIDVGVFYKF